MGEMIGFEKFLFQEDADYLLQLLHQNNIEVELDKPKTQFDAIVGHSRDNEFFILKIPQQKFDAAVQVIEKDLKEKGIPPDYHLQEMEADELMDILEHPDLWSRFDGAAAKILLQQRGVAITDNKIKVLTAARENYLKSQRTISNPKFIFFVFFSLFGGLVPAVVGSIIYSIKHTNIDGKKDFVFSEEGRSRGLVIAITGVLSTIGWYYYARYGF